MVVLISLLHEDRLFLQLSIIARRSPKFRYISLLSIECQCFVFARGGAGNCSRNGHVGVTPFPFCCGCSTELIPEELQESVSKYMLLDRDEFIESLAEVKQVLCCADVVHRINYCM